MTAAEERELTRELMDTYAAVKAVVEERDQLHADLEEARTLLNKIDVWRNSGGESWQNPMDGFPGDELADYAAAHFR